MPRRTRCRGHVAMMWRQWRATAGSEVLSRTLMSGIWQANPSESDDDSGTIELEVTACGDEDCSSSDVGIGDTLEHEYEKNDDGEIEVEVVPDTTATRSQLPPRVTSQVPGIELVLVVRRKPSTLPGTSPTLPATARCRPMTSSSRLPLSEAPSR